MKVLLLGLDGATFDYMDPWLEAGDLPHLAELIARGSRAVLHSTFLPVTAMAWPSMLTGKNPGKHGVFDFRTRRPGSYELQPSLVRGFGGTPLHVHLSRLGYRVAMINVPLTYPPRPLNGVMISGFTTPEEADNWAWPPSLPDELAAAGVPYPMDLLHELMRMEKLRRAGIEIERFIEGWGRFTEAQAAVVCHLLQRDEYDFFMLVFSSTDHINHHTPDREHIRRIYQQVDQAIGRILTVVDDDTAVLIVSDHGSAPLRRYIVLNRFLADMGLIAFRNEVAPRYVKLAAARVAWRWRERLAALWQGLPSPLRRLLSWPLLCIDERLRYDYTNIDWKRTRAYARSGIGALYINLKGREPEGIVEPGTEYEALRDRILRELLALRDPETGEPLIAEAVRAEDVFHGPYMDDAPDILFARRNPYDRAITGFASDPLVRPALTSREKYKEYGYHTRQGIFIAAGPGLHSRDRLKEAHIYDVAPTILHLLNLPVPRDMDGRVLLELFETPRPVRYTTSESDEARPDTEELAGEAKDEIEARLRALGYLE